jgi:transposase InsO family protein
MRKSRFSESQIVWILKEAENGRKVKDLCREYGISTACFYQWKSKYGGLEVIWSISASPNAELVNAMLGGALSTLAPGQRPVVHSDRGCYYRWPGWLKRLEATDLTRSMSRKGCTLDNAACEAFFGRLKVEFFYARQWTGTTMEQFIAELDAYIRWYNESLIKMSLGGRSPIEYRQDLGIAA